MPALPRQTMFGAELLEASPQVVSLIHANLIDLILLSKCCAKQLADVWLFNGQKLFDSVPHFEEVCFPSGQFSHSWRSTCNTIQYGPLGEICLRFECCHI